MHDLNAWIYLACNLIFFHRCLIFSYFLVFLQSVYLKQICNWSLSRFHYHRPAFTAPPRHESFNRFAPNHYCENTLIFKLKCISLCANLSFLWPELIPCLTVVSLHEHPRYSLILTCSGHGLWCVLPALMRRQVWKDQSRRKGGAEVNQESTRSGQEIKICLNNGIPQRFKGVNGTGNKAMIWLQFKHCSAFWSFYKI